MLTEAAGSGTGRRKRSKVSPDRPGGLCGRSGRSAPSTPMAPSSRSTICKESWSERGRWGGREGEWRCVGSVLRLYKPPQRQRINTEWFHRIEKEYNWNYSNSVKSKLPRDHCTIKRKVPLSVFNQLHSLLLNPHWLPVCFKFFSF